MSAGDSEAWVFTETGIDDLTAGQDKKRLGDGHAVKEATEGLTTLVRLPSGAYQDDVGVVVVAAR